MKLACIAVLFLFPFAASADSSVHYSDAALAFVKRFPSHILPACNFEKLQCRGLSMTVTSESTDSRYEKGRLYRTIKGAGLTIEYSLGKVSGLDVFRILITDPAVVLPIGLKVGDPIANVEKVLGVGKNNGNEAGSLEYIDENSLSQLVFFWDDKSRISSIMWKALRD